MMNTRPFGSVASLTELQGVFDDIGSTINAYNDQSPYGYFVPTGAGNSTAAYIATVSWGWPELEFGIYELGNTANTVQLFTQSTATPGDSVAIVFNQGAGTVTTVNLETWTMIDQTTDYFQTFGFYAITTMDTGVMGPFYSEDALNAGGFARFLTYESKGDNVTIPNKGTFNDLDHWYVAAEAGYYPTGDTTDGDFSDFVVQMESIAPVPVPAAALLAFLGLGAAGLKLRRFA
jgi:hypothetical protein